MNNEGDNKMTSSATWDSVKSGIPILTATADTRKYQEKATVINTDISTFVAQPEDNDPLFSISKWFLNKEAMSHKRLQKLCYYTYAWFIVFFNDAENIYPDSMQTLGNGKFEAWVHGPVLPKLYIMYREYGWSNIPQEMNLIALPQDLEDLAIQVWDAYGDLSADQLESLTHQEPPWINARDGIAKDVACSSRISDMDIFRYYSSIR